MFVARKLRDIVAEEEAEIADLKTRLEAFETEGSGPRREETVSSPTLGVSVHRQTPGGATRTIRYFHTHHS